MIEFNLDKVAIRQDVIPRLQDDAASIVDAVFGALARQLRDHGALDAPFEEQIRALLTSHLAIARAGEEMPEPAVLWRAWSDGMRAVKDLFVPIFTRLTRERDEARAEAARLREERAVVDNIYQDEREERAMHQAHAHNVEEERDALRQRAERAERELAIERSANGGARADAAHLKEQLDAALARIAELESRPESAAAMVEMLEIEFYRGAGSLGYGPVEPRKGIRAVLSALAVMGEEALSREVVDAIVARALYARGWASDERASDMSRAMGYELWEALRSRLPVFGALRLRVAELEAELGRHGVAASLQESGLVVSARATPEGYAVTPLPYHVHEVKLPDDGSDK